MIIYDKGHLMNIGITDTGAITNPREETVNPRKKPSSAVSTPRPLSEGGHVYGSLEGREIH